MGIFSPISATYGVRVDQLLETADDYRRYHSKLNRKLQGLRHRCQVVTKDTRKYSSKEKYSKFDNTEYDHKNKLYGVLVLLHAERDLSLVERLKLRARQRGKFKTSEKRVLRTRLRRAVQTTERLVNLTKNEGQWVTRMQYLIYRKLVHVEYLAHGNLSKNKDSKTISKELSLCFAALSHLRQSNLISETTFDFLQGTYEYTLKQHAGNILSTAELKNFVVTKVGEAHETDDELAKLLFSNGYKIELQDIKRDDTGSLEKIQWRAFTARIHDLQVENFIQEAQSIVIKNISSFDDKLSKWQQALERQEERIENHEAQEEEEEEEFDGVESSENDQILLAFIKYNMLFTSILRDNYLFNQLWNQWTKLGTSMPSKLTKYKEIERIVNNLLKYLQDIMELPGVYSDDNLLAQLQLCRIHFKLTLSSGCLASIYQSKGEYMKSLALHLDAHKQLSASLRDVGDLNEIIVPSNILSQRKINCLQHLIKTGWTSVLALAQYEKRLAEREQNKYEPSLIERLDFGSVKPEMIKLDNMFPLRPKLGPVPSKPTLFDLAFNYISYETTDEQKQNEAITTEQSAASFPDEKERAQTQQESNKKRGFLGIFSR